MKLKKLHKFLQDEEAARIESVKAEERQKSDVIKKKIETISREISSVSDTIQAIQEELKQDDVSFVQVIITGDLKVIITGDLKVVYLSSQTY